MHGESQWSACPAFMEGDCHCALNLRDSSAGSVATQHLATLSHPSPVPDEEAGACKGNMLADEPEIETFHAYSIPASEQISLSNANEHQNAKCRPRCLMERL